MPGVPPTPHVEVASVRRPKAMAGTRLNLKLRHDYRLNQSGKGSVPFNTSDSQHKRRKRHFVSLRIARWHRVVLGGSAIRRDILTWQTSSPTRSRMGLGSLYRSSSSSSNSPVPNRCPAAPVPFAPHDKTSWSSVTANEMSYPLNRVW